jgi:hypothetical protein
MSAETRAKLIRWTVILLTVAAFAGSYNHSAAWAALHGPDGFWAYFTAAIPEIMVITAVLKAQDYARDPAVWITGVSAVAFTLWANGASADPGASGMVVALWPAYAAVMALWLMGHASPSPAPAKLTVTRVRTTKPVTQRRSRIVLADQDPTKVITARVTGDQLAAGIAWIKAQPHYTTRLPSRPEIVKGADISDSTAKRARAAVLKELYVVTQGTDPNGKEFA